MPPPLRGKLQRGAVRQVTKSNFGQAIEQLRDHVRDADFIAVSSQKTGSAFFPSSTSSFPSFARAEAGGSPANHLGWRRVLPIDTAETAYLKAKLAAERFELLQFAVCPFRLQGSKVIAYPYNFHLFPRDELNLGMPSYSFSCQTSILTSMAHDGFDFNACIYDGLSYLSRVHESMTKDRNPIPTPGPITSGSVFSVADTIFVERSKSRIQQWRTACRGSIETSEDPLVRSLRKLMLGGEVYGSRPSMNIDVCNNRQVQLVMQILRQSFEDLVPLIIQNSEGEPTRVKIVLSSSEDDKNLLLREIQNSEEENDRKLRGFREVIDMLSSSQKSIITCKALNDFTFIHSKFVGPLPPSVAEFMCSLRLIFSNVIDINYLKEIVPLRKANDIPAAMSNLRRKFFVPTDMEIPEQDGEDLGNSHGHTVLRVANLFAKLSLLLKIDSIDCQSPPRVTNTTIENYANVFHHCCSDCRENVEDVDVWMNDLRKVSSNNLVFLWGFGNLDSSGALKQRLYGTHDSLSDDFELSMLDKGCAAVVFWKANLAQTFLQDVGSGNIHPGALSEMISDGLRVAGYETYKRVCGMGLWEMNLADAFDKFLIESTDDPPDNVREESSVVYWKQESMIHLNDL